MARFEDLQCSLWDTRSACTVQPALTGRAIAQARRLLDVTLPGSLLDGPYPVGEWGLPTGLVVSSGDGHRWIGLDYRTCGRHGGPSAARFDADFRTGLALVPDFRSFAEGLTAARHAE